MKKSLLALAVLGAFAGVASAQSSVTLFGVVDVNARFVNNDSVKQYQMNQDGINSSRLGFRGVEDLGGGMTAGFWLEGSLSPQNGTSSGQQWRRRSTVSLNGKFGEFRFGRDYTSTFWNSTIFDPFGTNGVGSAGNLVFILGACTPGLTGSSSSCLNLPTGTGYGTAVRADNIFGYFLPSGIAGGLYGQFQVAPGQNTPGNKYMGGRLGYAAGPFNVAGAWGRTQVTVGQVGPIGADQSGTTWNLGASWDFKFMALSGYWGSTDIGDASQDNWFIAAQAPLGAWTLKTSYGQMDRSGNAFGTNVEGQKANQWALGAVYDMSKRTALYGTWAGINNKGGNRYIVAPLIRIDLGGAVANGNSQGLEFGIRHSF